MVANDAVVRNVAVGEEIPVTANDGFLAGKGAAVHRAEFAEDIVAPDFEEGGFALVFEVLRLLSDRAEREETVAGTDARRTHEGDVVLKPAVFPENHPVADHAVGTDFGAAADFGFRRDDGGGVNGWHENARFL